MRQWFDGMSMQRVIDSHRYVAAGFPLYAAGIYNGSGTTGASGVNAGQAYYAQTYSNAVYPHSGGGSFETEGLYKPHSINGLIDRENMEARTCDRCKNKYRNQAALDRHRPTCVIPIDLSDDDDVIVDDSSNSQGTAPEGLGSKRPEYEHEVIMISDDEDDNNARIRSSAFGNFRAESNNGVGNGAAAAGCQLEGLAAGMYETVTNGKLLSDGFVVQSQVFNSTSNSVNGSGMPSAKILSCNSGQPSAGTLSSDNYRPVHCFQPVPLTESTPNSGLPAFIASSATFGAALLRTENSRSGLTSTVNNSIPKPDAIYLNGSSHNSLVPAARNHPGSYASQVQHFGSVQPYNGVSRDFSANSNSLRSPASSFKASQPLPAVNSMMPGKSFMVGNTTQETITLEDASGKVNRISVSTVPTVVINTASSARTYSLAAPSTPSVPIALKQGSWQYPAFPTCITQSANNTVNPVLAVSRPASSYMLQPSAFGSGSVLQQPFSTSVIAGPNGYRYETQIQAWNSQPSSSLTIANPSYPQNVNSVPQVPMPYPGYLSQPAAYYGLQQTNFPGRIPSSSYVCVNNNATSQCLPQIDLSTSFKQQQLTQVQRGFVLQNGAHDQYTNSTLPVISSQQVPVIQFGYRPGLQQFVSNGEMCTNTSTCMCARCLKNNMAARITEEMKKSALEATTTAANTATTSSHGIKRRMVDILPKPAKMFKCGNTLQLAKPPPKVILETSDVDSGYSDTSYSSKSSPQNNGSLCFHSSLTSHSPGPLQSLSRQLDRISNGASHSEFKPRDSTKLKKTKIVMRDSRKALGPSEMSNSIPLGTKKPLKEKPKSISPKQKRSPPPKMTAQQVKLTVKNKDGKNSYSIRDAKKNNSENLSAMKCLKVKAVKSATNGNKCSDVVVIPSIHVVPVPTASTENLTIAEEAEINGLKQEGDTVNQLQTHHCVIVYDVKVGAEIVFRSSDVRSVWDHVFFHVQGSIIKRYLPPLRYPPTSVQLPNIKSDFSTAGIDAVKIIHQAVQFLLQDLPKPEKKTSKQDLQLKKKPKKKFKQEDDEASAHKQSGDDILSSEDGDCIRIRLFERIKKFDMFGWLANPARRTKDVDLWVPIKKSAEKEIKRSGTLQYRNNSRALRKNTSGWDLCVLPSFIQGRGLFARKEIPENEIVIEYAGEIIRPILCDRREKLYESKGYGCYMFKIDDDEVVDATMRGNAARFINHSCEPNCKSKIVEVNGRKRIFIFTLRKITPQEELTYDYCFAKESRDKKLACTCGAPRCRKFLN